MTAIPDKLVKSYVAKGDIKITDLSHDDIQPASVDIGFCKGPIYRAMVSTPTITKEFLENECYYRGEITDGFVFEPGATYIVQGPRIENHTDFFASVEQKSTAGRLGLFSEMIPDGSKRANHLEPGYEGNIFWRIENRAFPIKFQSGDKISQLRFRQKNTGYMRHETLKATYGNGIGMWNDLGLIPPERAIDGNTTPVTLDSSRFLAQKADVTIPLDYSKPGSADIEDYFHVILNGKPMIDVKPYRLLLMGTKERSDVGSNFCAQMGMKTEGLGIHIETHNAGFIDNGFNATVTAEVLNLGRTMVRMTDGQYLSHLKWEELADSGEKTYNGNYAGQNAPVPPKHFKDHLNVWKRAYNEDIDAVRVA